MMMPSDHYRLDTDELAWVTEQMPLTAAIGAVLPALPGVRLACSMHLEIKMIPLLEALIERGIQLCLTTCNPSTVQTATCDYLRSRGARVYASPIMSAAEQIAAWQAAADFKPTHLCEMGAALSLFLARPEAQAARDGVKASLEATGTGTNRLASLQLPYPIFNWDDLPIKEGLHNRHMVGLTACHAFFERTRLTFHGKRVLVIGFGLVGRGVADAARAYGGQVSVAERDPARALEARFAGWSVLPLTEALPNADVVITATGAVAVLGAAHLPLCKRGAFLMNVGHADEEIDLLWLRTHPHRQVRPFVERFDLPRGDGKSYPLYLFAEGSMANLSAGQGDSLNAFDITSATLLAAIDFMLRESQRYPGGVHLLPQSAWRKVAAAAMQPPSGLQPGTCVSG